ncbi:MAG: hypothetical protein ACI86M_000199 [Saprospiraceae bacterium]|jgi:hypothetical protein
MTSTLWAGYTLTSNNRAGKIILMAIIIKIKRGRKTPNTIYY